MRDILASIDPNLVMIDGCDEAIIGVIDYLSVMHVAYSYTKLVEIFMADMSEEEAREWIDYNILNAFVGENTPMIIQDDIVGY